MLDESAPTGDRAGDAFSLSMIIQCQVYMACVPGFAGMPTSCVMFSNATMPWPQTEDDVGSPSCASTMRHQK